MTKHLVHDEPVVVWTGSAMLSGRLLEPSEASALLLVASANGTATHAGYNAVANHLTHHGFAVLEADLLTEDEAEFDSRTGHYRCNIPMLSTRLIGVADWAVREKHLRNLPIAILTSGPVAAAALNVAARQPGKFDALILADARTDLVEDILPNVKAPTLLIAPDSDLAILRMNREAEELLRYTKRLEVLPESTHVFADSAHTEAIAGLALSWAAAYAQPVYA
ncbi:MAG TPA: alpha/beta hydrolase [Thermoanaerobaculia bacterium]|nr:alpha/beta hydrolase [Thermoanaerobaculia bacterium]